MTFSQLSEAATNTFNYITPVLDYIVSRGRLAAGAVVAAVLLRWSLSGKRTLVPCFQVQRTLSAGCYYPSGGVA